MSHSHFKMLSCHMPRGTAKKSQKSLCKIGGFLAEIWNETGQESGSRAVILRQLTTERD